MKSISSGLERGLRLGVVIAVTAAVLGAAGSANAGRSWDEDILTVAELQAGAMFASGDGQVEFSDFEFNAVGFDDSAFDEFLVQPRDAGFRLILGFGEPFGPGSLAMRYTVTAVPGRAIEAASIPLLALLEAIGASPLVETDWQADNGAMLSASSDDTDNFPWPGVSTSFDPVVSLLVEQVVTLSGGSGIVKVENAYRVVKVVPEPSTAVLLALALGGALAVGRKR